MTGMQEFLLTVSLMLWGVLIVVEFIRHKKAYLWWGIVQLVLITLCIGLFHTYLGYLDGIDHKFSLNYSEIAVIVLLYLATVAGIAGNHFFAQIKNLHDKGRQRKIKFFPLLKPLIISPIIFLAVLSQFNQMGVQIDSATALVIQLGLAFQNGFFWKTILDQVGGGYAETQNG